MLKLLKDIVKYCYTPAYPVLSASCIFAQAGGENSYLGQWNIILLLSITVRETMPPVQFELSFVACQPAECLWVPGVPRSLIFGLGQVPAFFCFLLASLLTAPGVHLVASLTLLSQQCLLRVWTLPLRFPYSHKLDYVLPSKYICFSNAHHLFRKQQ